MLESTTDQSKQFNNRNFSQVKKKNRTWEEKEKKERQRRGEGKSRLLSRFRHTERHTGHIPTPPAPLG